MDFQALQPISMPQYAKLLGETSRGFLIFRLLFAYTEGVSNVCMCRASFTDTEGITHSVKVTAGSLFEAAALGVAEFRRCAMMDAAPGLETRLTKRRSKPRR